MRLMDRKELEESLNSEDSESIFIDPLLDRQRQLGHVTIDLRLGYDFLVSILTRKAYIELWQSSDDPPRDISAYFQQTRRDLGEKFLLYPGQIAITTTLEYVSAPTGVYMDILSRSSYTRLGIPINTMVQPGFRGCVPLELFNNNNNAVELIVGSRICQARFFDTDSNLEYLEGEDVRKYYGDVRPTVSRADADGELVRLGQIAERR